MPRFLDSLILMEPMPPDAPICYNWYLYSRIGGGYRGGRGAWNDDCQSVPDLTEKSPLFQTPQKAAPSDPGIAFSRICVDLGELFEVIWWLFFTKKWKKCVWTAPACTDRMSDLPENYTFLRCCLSFSGVFPRGRFLCTFWAPRPPKPQKVVQKGWGNRHVLGVFFEIWSHSGPQVPKMTPRDPKTEPPSIPREPQREKSAQNVPQNEPKLQKVT